MNDLDHRVRTRLKQLERFAIGMLYDNNAPRWPDHLALMVWDRPQAAMPVIDSWRKNWELHRPEKVNAVITLCASRCSYEERVMNRTDRVEHRWPCPAALSICTNIGVEL